MAVIKGGEKLEARLKEIASGLKNGAQLRVGFLEGSTDENGVSNAMKAAIQNFGAPNRGIPPRPFFSNMVKDKSPEWPTALEEALKDTGYQADAAMRNMGEGIKGQLQQSIRDTYSPPLSPITVMLRGMRSQGRNITGATVGEAARRVRDGKTNYGASTKPLIDHGDMMNAADYEVSS